MKDKLKMATPAMFIPLLMDGHGGYQEAFFEAIKQERHEQDMEFGGSEHDDSCHDYFDWVDLIEQQLRNILLAPPIGQEKTRKATLDRAMREGDNFELFENRMVKVAALALAAAQSERRKARS